MTPDFIVNYYILQSEYGKLLPIWVWDKYILPYTKG